MNDLRRSQPDAGRLALQAVLVAVAAVVAVAVGVHHAFEVVLPQWLVASNIAIMSGATFGQLRQRALAAID
jgi:hypothetical protein